MYMHAAPAARAACLRYGEMEGLGMNLPNLELLDLVPVEVRRIKALEKGSKAYKKAVGALKAKLGPLLVDNLQRGTDEPAEPFRRKWKSCYRMTILYAAVMLATAILMCVWMESTEGETPVEWVALGLWIFVVLFSFGMCMLYCVMSTRQVTAYLVFLIEDYHHQPPDCPDELLAAAVETARYYHLNPQPFEPGDVCGCIHCLAVFPAEEAVFTPDDDTVCPHCGQRTVIGGEDGQPPDGELLRVMQAYFFPESSGD